jgi:dTDP-glucose 4,6-dehydratase
MNGFQFLVTGGLGFIGSHLVNHILNNKGSVINIDYQSYASLENPVFKNHPNYKHIKIDLANTKDIIDLVGDLKPDCIFHLAAESHVDNSIRSPYPFIHSNILGTYSLLEAIRQYFPDNKNLRSIFVSTDEVFGDLGDSKRKFNLSSNYHPSSPYSSTKASADLLARAWMRTYELPVIITNCSNNYGPWQHSEKLIPKIIQSCMKKRPIPVYGDGMQMRDWLFVQDHIEGLYQLASNGNIGETYLFGTGRATKNIDLVKLIIQKFQTITNEDFNFNGLIEFVEDRPGHDYRYCIDSSCSRDKIGWHPKFNLEVGIELTIKSYI